MKFLTSILLALLLFAKAEAQNVAINNDGSAPDPKAQLDIKSTNKGVLLPRITDLSAITGNVPLGLIVFVTDGNRGFYYNSSALAGIPNWQKLATGDGSQWTTASPNFLYANSYNVGIGNTDPTEGGLVVDRKVGAVHAMFGSNTSGVSLESAWPGIGLNSYFSSTRKAIAAGYGGWIGQDPTAGNLYLQTSATNAGTAGAALSLITRLLINKDGEIGIEGNTNPHAPLSFANTAGGKISLYGSSPTSNYGIGIQGYLMQLYTDASNADIAFGYGGTASFTETMRMRGNGNVGIGLTNPSEKLEVNGAARTKKLNVSGTISGFDALAQFNATGSGFNGLFTGGTYGIYTSGTAASGIWVSTAGDGSAAILIDKGRLRLKGNLSNGNAHGVMFTNNAGTTDRGFVGMYDDNSLGYYGSGGAGWGFLWDVNDGSLRVGTTQKANGYMLNIGGKAIAEEVRVQLRGNWPDYVFKQGYKLLPLSQLEAYIQQNKHLPNIPKAEVLEKDGTDLGEMQRRMMEKIEELTLYIIELKKEIDVLKAGKN